MISMCFFCRFWSRFGADFLHLQHQKLIRFVVFCEGNVKFALVEQVTFQRRFLGSVGVILAFQEGQVGTRTVDRAGSSSHFGPTLEPVRVALGGFSFPLENPIWFLASFQVDFWAHFGAAC